MNGEEWKVVAVQKHADGRWVMSGLSISQLTKVIKPPALGTAIIDQRAGKVLTHRDLSNVLCQSSHVDGSIARGDGPVADCAIRIESPTFHAA